MIWLARKNPPKDKGLFVSPRELRLYKQLQHARSLSVKDEVDRLEAFWKALLEPGERNHDIGQDTRIERRVGRVSDIKKHDKQAVLHLEDGSSVLCDEVVVSIGQNPEAPGGPVDLCREVGPLDLLLFGTPERLVGLKARKTDLRILGGSCSVDHSFWGERLDDADREELQDRLLDQLDSTSVPRYSRGIPGTIYQICQDVPLANRHMS